MRKRSSRRQSSIKLKIGASSDPDENLKRELDQAQRHVMLLGQDVDWNSSLWTLSAKLFGKLGQNTVSVTLGFSLPQALGGRPLTGDWATIAKVMVVQRESKQHKSVSSHRTFIQVVGYISEAANGAPIKKLTRAILDRASNNISKSTRSESEAYKRHNLLKEFVRRCSESGFCYVSLGDYNYTGSKRPISHGGRTGKRLDDPTIQNEKSDRVIALETYEMLGELNRNVPVDHKYRAFLLVITLLVCTGRRLSEITLLPRQALEITSHGAFFYHLKLKGQQGSRERTLVRVPLLSVVVPLVQRVLEEISANSKKFYSVAEEMCRTSGPDLRFLSNVRPDEPLFYERLLEMGMPVKMFESGGCFRNCSMGLGKERHVFKDDVVKYCQSHFDPVLVAPLFEVESRPYFITDMLLLNYRGTSSGHYATWVVNVVTAISLSNFLKGLDNFAREYASKRLTDKFTSHDFRHTLNDALDRGGLPDLMQAQFFGRTHQRDTSAYQHTSPEQKALRIRKKIKLGQARGQIVERAMRVPTARREAFLSTAVKAVHDLGNGYCVHLWNQGGCARHLDCDTGCDKYVYLVVPEGADELERAAVIIHEIKLQLAQNFLTLNVAVSEGIHERAPQWAGHIGKKVHQLMRQLEDMGEVFGYDEVEEFINTGQLDGLALSEITDGVMDGFSRYVEIREKLNAAIVEQRTEYPDFYPGKPVQFIPVKALDDEISKDD